MAERLSTLTLPAEGYGPEPKSDMDAMKMSAARVMLTLPPNWTVQASMHVGGMVSSSEGARTPDFQLTLMHRGREAQTYTAQVKRVLNPSGLFPMIDEIAREDASRGETSPSMVVARYLSAPQQQTLRRRRISYADATGNLFLESEEPLIAVSSQGANADPWRGPGRPTTSVKGLPAARLIRALADYSPPYTVAVLADLARTSLGATYRLIDYLVSERVVTRADRGPITDVNWPDLLRRWAQEASLLSTGPTFGFLEPRGVEVLTRNLSEFALQRYAVTGSLAAQPYAPYADARLGIIYTDDPSTLAAEVGLRPVDSGANVILAKPRSPVVFERTSTWKGITIVAPAQAAADLLSGPGRNPTEGEHLLTWMEENPDAWRQQPSH